MIDLVSFKEGIAAKLLAEGSTANVVFGRSHLVRQDNQGPGTANRVVVAPGAPDGSWGEIRVGSKAHTREQPDEATHGEIVTLDVWAYDPENPSDEALQYRAMRGLWQCVVRAVGAILREEAHESNTWWGSNADIPPKPIDRRHGERCQIVFAIDFSVRAPTPAESVTDADVAPLGAEVEP